MNKKGALFHFTGGTIDPEEGEVYQFNNQVEHWVDNGSDEVRLSLVLCIRTEDTLLNQGVN